MLNKCSVESPSKTLLNIFQPQRVANVDVFKDFQSEDPAIFWFAGGQNGVNCLSIPKKRASGFGRSVGGEKTLVTNYGVLKAVFPKEFFTFQKYDR